MSTTKKISHFHRNNEQDEFFSSIKINPSIHRYTRRSRRITAGYICFSRYNQNCTRKEGRRELIPKI